MPRKKQREKEEKRERERKLFDQARGYEGKDAATVISELDSQSLTGTIKTNANINVDMANTIRGSIADGISYIVTSATATDGKINLIVDTLDHYNREQRIEAAKLPIMTACEDAGKKAYPYGFKRPLTGADNGVVFSDDTNWSYTFEANITNMFKATMKKVPVTCTGTWDGQTATVTGIQ